MKWYGIFYGNGKELVPLAIDKFWFERYLIEAIEGWLSEFDT